MFRALVGEPFDRLPRPIRDAHAAEPELVMRGRCDIARGTHPLARLLAAATFLPHAGRDVPTEVRIVREARREVWIRDFAGRRMRSTLRARGRCLEERLGAATFRFALAAEGEALRWRLVGVRALGIPVPLAWFRGVEARESAEGGVYRFEVRAAVPLAGLLVHYRGWLARP